MHGSGGKEDLVNATILPSQQRDWCWQGHFIQPELQLCWALRWWNIADVGAQCQQSQGKKSTIHLCVSDETILEYIVITVAEKEIWRGKSIITDLISRDRSHRIKFAICSLSFFCFCVYNASKLHVHSKICKIRLWLHSPIKRSSLCEIVFQVSLGAMQKQSPYVLFHFNSVWVHIVVQNSSFILAPLMSLISLPHKNF